LVRPAGVEPARSQ